MAHDKTEIVNTALANINVATYTTLPTSGRVAALIDLHYDQALQAVLEAHAWSFADLAAELDLLTTQPDQLRDFAYAYELPDDCVVPRRLYRFKTQTPYEFRVVKQEGASDDEMLLCDVDEPILEYTAAVTDPTKFSQHFRDALAWDLARRFVRPFKAKLALIKDCKEEYREALAIAGASDANKGYRDNVNFGHRRDPRYGGHS
jgi:hypothetical protein